MHVWFDTIQLSNCQEIADAQLRVKTDEFWMENIVKTGLVIQNRVMEHCQTCSKHGPAPESDERTCWSCLCFEENSNH